MDCQNDSKFGMAVHSGDLPVVVGYSLFFVLSVVRCVELFSILIC